MLQHPFETEDDIRQTLNYALNYPPFELQLHGLNFLPGTDIVKRRLSWNLYKKKWTGLFIARCRINLTPLGARAGEIINPLLCPDLFNQFFKNNLIWLRIINPTTCGMGAKIIQLFKPAAGLGNYLKALLVAGIR